MLRDLPALLYLCYRPVDRDPDLKGIGLPLCCCATQFYGAVFRKFLKKGGKGKKEFSDQSSKEMRGINQIQLQKWVARTIKHKTMVYTANEMGRWIKE